MSYLTSGQVAKACEVSRAAVKKWIQGGKLQAYRTPGGHLRITLEEFQRFQAVYRFPPVPPETLRILIADSDASLVEWLLDALAPSRLAPTLEWAATGSEALLKAGTFQPHLLLLELCLPDLRGEEVCRQIKGHPQTQGIKIVAMSADPQMLQQARARGCEADAWLAKPFTLRELLAQGPISLRPSPTQNETSLPASPPPKGATDGYQTLR